MNPGRRYPGSLVYVMSLLCFIFLFASFIAASDFDFYGSDLVSKESYRRISMDFKDAGLKNILKIFSEQAGLNFIAAQGIQDRNITLYLDNVPLQDALKKIMAANNLKYELEPGGNIFIVKESGAPDIDVVTKIYNLKYARLKDSKLNKVIGQGGASGQAGGGGEAAAGGAAEGGGGSAQGGAGGGIEDIVKGVLTSHGKLMSDSRTNSLVIMDVPTQFDVIDKVIALLDVPSPQVMIEVEMLDVSKDVLDQWGVATSSQLMSLTGASRETRFPFHTLGMSNQLFNSAPSFTYGTLSAAVFNAVLELLTTETDTKFLARPRILTVSNETAEIKITTQEAIGTQSVTTASQGASTSTESAERMDTGVSLKVTPQVDLQTGYVTMFVQPSVSETKSSTISVGGNAVKDPEVRSSATTLMVRNGETIVMGGLIRTKEETTYTKMPFVGDIPFLGALFRHKNKQHKERELIVFITPRIMGYDQALSLAKTESGAPTPVIIPSREQPATVFRKEKIDNMLERWEN